jgi:hypothetical protein
MVNFIFNFYPAVIIRNYETVQAHHHGRGDLISSALILAGFIKAKNPGLRELSITMTRKAGAISSLRVAMCERHPSGHLITNSRFMKIVDMVNGC